MMAKKPDSISLSAIKLALNRNISSQYLLTLKILCYVPRMHPTIVILSLGITTFFLALSLRHHGENPE